ncbi:MAG: radical SAM protein [Thermoflexales bacterium]|nr:radical SAM protein [Thermoflexales bacterium]
MRRSRPPSYVALHASGELARRAEHARAALERCELCPRRCGVKRLDGERGPCGMGELPVVAAWNVHPWEEPPISGCSGSGTVFFSGCTGRCIFCQNYPISQLHHGQQVSYERLAEMMLELQNKKGCHNINLVTPTHFVPAILAAVDIAAGLGLGIPLVYNCSGYETLETLRWLEGVIDIYLPDAKYADDGIARRLSGFPRYVEHNRATLKEIARQVGDDLVLDDDGLAVRGMIVRHLVLPENLAGTPEVLGWIATELSPRVHVSLMDQYFPAHKALDHPQLGRKITPEEYEAALQAFDEAGLENGWMQEHEE